MRLQAALRQLIRGPQAHSACSTEFPCGKDWPGIRLRTLRRDRRPTLPGADCLFVFSLFEYSVLNIESSNIYYYCKFLLFNIQHGTRNIQVYQMFYDFNRKRMQKMKVSPITPKNQSLDFVALPDMSRHSHEVRHVTP